MNTERQARADYEADMRELAMRPTVTDVFDAAIRVSQAGKYYVFARLAPHVQYVEFRIMRAPDYINQLCGFRIEYDGRPWHLCLEGETAMNASDALRLMDSLLAGEEPAEWADPP